MGPNSAPLSWDLGWPARAVSGGLWRLAVTEFEVGTFMFKALVDDTDWQLGDDETGSAGVVNALSPVF